MSGFGAWGLTVLALAVVTTIAEMLLPKGKTKNVIRSVVATVTVLAIITPIPSLIKNGIGGFDFSGDTIDTDKTYLDYVQNMRCAAVERATESYLAGEGYKGIKLKVTMSGEYDVSSVTVDFSQSGITDKDGHIHKSEIVKLIADRLHIGEEAIMTYG